MMASVQSLDKQIEIFIRQDGKAYKVVLSGEAMEDIDNLTHKLGTQSVTEAIIYSLKIISEGVKNVQSGDHKITLPNGKKATLNFGID